MGAPPPLATLRHAGAHRFKRGTFLLALGAAACTRPDNATPTPPIVPTVTPVKPPEASPRVAAPENQSELVNRLAVGEISFTPDDQDLIWGDYLHGQVFTSPVTAPVSLVGLFLSKRGNPTSRLNIELRDLEKAITEKPLGVGGFDPQKLTNDPMQYRATQLSEPVVLQQGKRYAILARAEKAQSAEDSFVWHKKKGPRYDDPKLNQAAAGGDLRPDTGKMLYRIYVKLDPKEEDKKLKSQPLIPHPDNNLTFYYPQGWMQRSYTFADRTPERMVFGGKVNLYAGDEMGDQISRITVAVEPASPQEDLNTYVQAAAAQISSAHPEASIDRLPVKIGADQGMLLKFSTLDGYVALALAKKGANVYRIGLQTPYVTFPEQVDRFSQKILPATKLAAS